MNKNHLLYLVCLTSLTLALALSARAEDAPAAQASPATEPATTRPAARKVSEVDPALKRLEQLRTEFQNAAIGDDKTVKLDTFLTEAIAAANAFCADLKYEDALRAISLAKPIAMQTKATQLAELNDLSKDASRKKIILNRIDDQIDRWERNKADQNLAKQIIEAYLLELDAPAQAAVVAAECGDPDLIAKVGKAIVEPSALNLADTIELGDWYTALAKKPGPGKAVATERALSYYQSAVSAGISDDKTKKRVELAIKSLSAGNAMASADDAHRNNEITNAMANIFAQLKPEFQPPKSGWWHDESKRAAVTAILNQKIPANTVGSFQGTIKDIGRPERFTKDKYILRITVSLPDVANRKTETWARIYIPESEVGKYMPGAQVFCRGPIKQINLWSERNQLEMGIVKVLGLKPAGDVMMTR